jgi:hypothetical protein
MSLYIIEQLCQTKTCYYQMHACARVVMAVDALSAGLISEPVGAASVVRPVCLAAVGAARTLCVTAPYRARTSHEMMPVIVSRTCCPNK